MATFDEGMMEVDFKKYCPLCKHVDVPEIKDPCDECLCQGWNQYSRKPIKYEEKK